MSRCHKERLLVNPDHHMPSVPAALSLHQMLQTQAERTPDALALLAPGRQPLTYRRLATQVDDIVRMLTRMGLRGDARVALVLPNGPEMATAFLGVAARATCAPLNPAYRAEEVAFYLTDLRAQALIIQAGMDVPARAVAQAYGLQIIELSPSLEAAAGLFTLSGEAAPCAGAPQLAQPDDIALMLHTAGTTSRPKLVPLTHAQIALGAYNTRMALELTASDRCLNVMPLFHVHGLIGALLASLSAGASIVCTPGFAASTFFTWLAAFQPTWYTAVPTIHQAILAQADQHCDTLARYPLRFLRSAAASLPRAVFEALERVFNCPVIEAYGMTEAASQITCNPLPPRPRKIGSVGIAGGPEVAVMDVEGNLLPAGAHGEIVIRGPNVMRGYENAPLDNHSAFRQGWFRTGDQGFLDDEGYLFIDGRMKEVISRGGEKIMPQEVDQVLLAHPAVAQAVTFAVPHGQLGEDVAAAVVLRPQATATASDLRSFAATRLAAFKVPRHVYIMEKLPQSSIGKLKRLQVAEQLGLTDLTQGPSGQLTDRTAPRTPVEEILSGLWSEVFGGRPVGIDDDFFTLGGDSLSAAQVLNRIRETVHVKMSFLSFFETPTIAGLASRIETAHPTAQHLVQDAIAPVPRRRTMPVSRGQEQIWRLDQSHADTAFLNTAYAVRLQGILEVSLVEKALNALIRRHEVLRTTFRLIDKELRQVIAPRLDVSISVVNQPVVPLHDREAQRQRLIQTQVQQPFDLAQGPLLRLSVWRLDEQEHLLLVTLPHLISDRWSLGVFMREFMALYDAFSTGAPPSLPALSIQYADFAHWQRHWQHSPAMRSQLAYWKRQLRGPLRRLALPTEHPRRAHASQHPRRHMADEALHLPQALADALTHLSRQEGCTLFMILLAAWKILLYRDTGQPDLRVVTPIANRQQRETEGAIGLFTNTVLLRTDLSGHPTYREGMQRVRATALAAYANQQFPFEELVRILEAERGLDRSSLSQVMVIWQQDVLTTLPYVTPCLSFLEVEQRMLIHDVTVTTFDMILVLRSRRGELDAVCLYNAVRFDAATIRRMLEGFQQVLQELVRRPEQVISA